jgi:hypothetical protein
MPAEAACILGSLLGLLLGGLVVALGWSVDRHWWRIGSPTPPDPEDLALWLLFGASALLTLAALLMLAWALWIASS